MANTPSPKPTFTVWRRWNIFVSVLFSVISVFALMVMINYLAARYYTRFPWSKETRTEISPQTMSVLKSVTNDLNVVIYYDKKDYLYSYIKDLLDAFRLINPKINVQTVDYLVDAGESRKLKETYKNVMGAGLDTNLVIFSMSNRVGIIPGERLGHYVLETVPNEKEREFRNKLESFNGESLFVQGILQLYSKPLRAYFLETPKTPHRLDGQGPADYQQFKAYLNVNNIDITAIPFLDGTNGIPGDCNLLIIAAPWILSHTERDNVKKYLEQGGRLFVLFNHESREINTGLEPILAEWGIYVKGNTVADPEHSPNKSDLIVTALNKSHPAVSHLAAFGLQLSLPREVGTNSDKQISESVTAQELAWTSEQPFIDGSLTNVGHRVPLMASVEKGTVKGITERGTTRILVVGDSYFLDNHWIEGARNRAFAGYAVNWLMGQTQMLQGVAPHVITEYKLRMTPAQLQNVRWIFLAAMPGGILFFGFLVWLRRRR